MGKDLENVFRELKDDVSSFAELKLELLKLNTYERISKVIAILSYGLLLSALVILALLFTMLTLGFLFSTWLDSTTAGFGIVAVLYLILIVIVILNKQRICLKVVNIVISTLYATDKKNAEPENKTYETANSD
jgi:hypothetical protein